MAQSRAREISTRMALVMASKGSSTIGEYFSKMKGLVDEMAYAGCCLEDEELICNILTGLDMEYNPVVSAVAARVQPISVGELYTQLVSFKQQMELHARGGSHSSVNMASKGGHSSFTHGRGDRGSIGCSQKGGRGSGSGQGGPNHGVTCQLCRKEGHTALQCFKRFDATFTGPPQKSTSSATTPYGIDTNWYMDTSATDHVTRKLEQLTVRDNYHDGDQVHTASGAGMRINHVGHSTLHSPVSKLHLNNILHVPTANKSLVSVNRLACDNNVFLEFHPDHFVIKEQVTRKTLLRGQCEGGLYPLKPFPNKQVLGVFKPTASLWYQRLGHASTPIVQQVLSRHKLPFVRDSVNNLILDACQKGKSHQLPYPKSTSISSSPLELVFLDVWGPAPTSVGRYDYYVSFIDDTQVYLDLFVCHKYEVFRYFHDFQNLVGR